MEEIKSSIDNDMNFPADFSFCSITDITELLYEKPRPMLDKEVSKVTVTELNENGEEVLVQKYQTRSVRVNNNMLPLLESLSTVLNTILLEPEMLSWLDFSFNELVEINPAICEFPNLKILNLHGNSIRDIQEVDKLSALQNLIKLSLHGNAIETVPNYRWYVLSLIPNLKSFDMATITKADRYTAKFWRAGYALTAGRKRRKKTSIA